MKKTDPSKLAFENSTEIGRVRHQLQELCSALEPGDKLPSLPELMLSLNASERYTQKALAEFQTNGLLIRRKRLGTFVANPSEVSSVSKKKSGIRTLIAIAHSDHAYFSHNLDVLSRIAEAYNIRLIYHVVSQKEPNVADFADHLGPTTGILVFSHLLAQLAVRLQDAGHRVVLMGASYVGVSSGIMCVVGDQEHGAYLATQHLLALGHRQIACVHSSDSIKETYRWRGHQQALSEARTGGVTVYDFLLTDDLVEPWRVKPDLAGSFFRQSNAPTALIAWNDHEAVQLLTILLQAGIRVPHDVSIVGFDNLPESLMVQPNLSTVDQAVAKQLGIAIKLLSNPSETGAYTLKVPATLIARTSTKAIS